MIAAIVDTETTGLDIKEAKVLELSIVIYDTENDRILLTQSYLVRYPNLYVPVDATAINGITAKMCTGYGYDYSVVLSLLEELLLKCDCVIAHNGSSYDFAILERDGFKIPIPKICSKVDIKWPYQSKRLIYLVAEMGCQVMTAHTALSDCLMLLDVLKKGNKWDEINNIIKSRSNKLKLVYTDRTNLW